MTPYTINSYRQGKAAVTRDGRPVSNVRIGLDKDYPIRGNVYINGKGDMNVGWSSTGRWLSEQLNLATDIFEK